MTKDPYQLYLAELEKMRRPALEAARVLLEEGRYDEAERGIAAADDSIYGAVAIAKLYREWLQTLVDRREPCADRATIEAVFDRAEHWAHSAYPEPHTACEADNWARGRLEDTATLVQILGYNPRER